jgi:hypothetical protein
LRTLLRLRYLELLKHDDLLRYPLEYRPTHKGDVVIRSPEIIG